jgi:tetratricopeptide (TPR) repeat protein
LTLDGQGRLEAAVGDYTAALSLEPRATYALNNRANVYRRQNRYAEARRDYAAALEAGTPNPQYPWYGLGQIAEAENDPQTARTLYYRVLTADPSFQLARERLLALAALTKDSVGLAADVGPIIMQPPPSRDESTIVLRAPPKAESVTVVAVSSPGRVRAASFQNVQMPRPRSGAPVPAPGRGAPLRPAIVESGEARALVQLGAWRSEAEARQGWALAQTAAEGLLEAVEPFIVRVELPKRGSFYRLRVQARDGSAAFCAALKKKGVSCILVRD